MEREFSLAIDPNLNALRMDRPIVGPKILNRDAFLRVVHKVVPEHIRFETPDADDTWIVGLPDSFLSHVSSGIGMRKLKDDPNRYVLRMHRGRMQALLKREFALPPTGCTVHVITRDQYLKECNEYDAPPIVLEANPDVTHIVVGFKVATDATSHSIKQAEDLVTYVARNATMSTRDYERLHIRAVNSKDFWRQFCEVSD